MLIREFNATTGEWSEREVAAGEIEPVVMPPAPRNALTPREFMDRLPMARQGEITAAAMQSAPVFLWLLRLTGAKEVDPAHEETRAGVTALRVAGVITEQEAAALLAPA